MRPRHRCHPVVRQKLESPENAPKYDPFGIALLSVPIASFALGTWQVKRRKWKLQLIANLTERFNSAPEEFPHDLSLLDDMEYRPVRVRGQFDHSRELYMGPRSLIVDGDSQTGAGVFSQGSSGQTGYLVITPFHLADRDLAILVNRGWVPSRLKSPELRQAGQVEGEVELVGIVRLNESRPPFLPKNTPGSWVYRDLPEMANATGAAPVFMDATASSTVPGGPTGGQTRVTLRNEHMSYIITCYIISLFTFLEKHRNIGRRICFIVPATEAYSKITAMGHASLICLKSYTNGVIRSSGTIKVVQVQDTTKLERGLYKEASNHPCQSSSAHRPHWSASSKVRKESSSSAQQLEEDSLSSSSNLPKARPPTTSNLHQVLLQHRLLQLSQGNLYNSTLTPR
ncbi:hypothetical protein PR048_022301 [Dryococelus australis]|uniref:SURF1-like protein n=1 Tax=Dryococelus australis TaxID=614101 RepID=A0ABQ9H0P8_9NEOP|nr:hypothetical protein PR048_022301 [Dryococelus australis]